MLDKYLIAEELLLESQSSEISQDEETMIWRFGGTQNQYYTVKDVELIFKSSGSLTITFTFISNRTRSVRVHPPVTITLWDSKGNVILNWDTGTLPYQCNTNLKYTKVKSGLNIYDKAIKGYFLIGGYRYSPC